MEDPKQVAATMLAIRGREQSIARCDRYISGAIRSENPREFWTAVKAELERVAA